MGCLDSKRWELGLVVLLACGCQAPTEGAGTQSGSESTSEVGSETEVTTQTTDDPTSATDPSGTESEGETTAGPTTEEPTTEEPTTEDPTTEEPTTEEPTTEDPTTEDPTTEDPTTEDPSESDSDTDDPTSPVRLHEVQVKGTHNSYHVEPPLPLDGSHEYSHLPLDEQLADQGVRAFELDIHRGFSELEVYHITVIDSVTTCDAFVDCVGVIEDWSAENPQHMPIVVWIEIKDETGGLPINDMEEVDDDIRAVIDEADLLTPDDIQGDAESVRAALEVDGWPLVDDLRGQVMFVLLNAEDDHADEYTYGYDNLGGRAMFARSGSSQFDLPWSAVAKLGANDSKVAEAQARYMLVATNVCGADESDNACFDQFETAKAAGIHMLKDDFPGPVGGQEYWMDLAEGTPARCNPVTASPDCTSEGIENLP
ncbi:MAG: Ca2+-dependent phosphoinositide-specific phospholipase C [Nannocystaceae bacterium]